MADEGIHAIARALGVAPSIEAIAGYYRAHGLPTREFRFLHGGPECAADRDKEIQKRRAEQPAPERKQLMPKRSGLSMKARMCALRELQERYPEEFDELHRKHRVELGLPEEVPPPRVSAKAELELLREQLRAAGLEPKV